MSARVQRQLALALRSAKGTRKLLYSAWQSDNQFLAERVRELHAKACQLVDRIGAELTAAQTKPARHDGRKAASGE